MQNVVTRQDDLLCSSIPSRLPDGRTNPEYMRAYNKRRKEAGNPVVTAEYYKQYRQRRLDEGRPMKGQTAEGRREYRKTEKGKAEMKRWNESEKGKAARAKYRASPIYKRKRHESGEEYASRIIRECEEIYQHNNNNNEK